MDYRGSEPMLDEAQRAQLDAHLSQTIYLRVADIAAYVKNRFGVGYSVQGLTDLLHRMGYSYKKPKVVPGKADAAAQEAWVQWYEQIKQSKGENDPIYFMDAAHPQHNTTARLVESPQNMVTGCGWIKRGVEKQIKSNTGRQRINLNGAIDVQTMQVAARGDSTRRAVTRTDPTIKRRNSLAVWSG